MWMTRPCLSKQFRLVRYDRRGHGKSGAPKGPYSMDMLGGDAWPSPTPPASRSSVGAGCRWAAWSDNGWAPMRAIRVRSSSSQHALFTPTSSPGMTASSLPATTVLEKLSAPQMERWFTKGFRDASPGPVGKVVEMFQRPSSTASSVAARRCATWTSAPRP